MADSIERINQPDTRGVAYVAMELQRSLIRDLMGGTAAMQLARERWLPRWPKEDPTRYEIRVQNSTLFNALERTVDVMAGKVFRAPPTVEAPPSVLDWLENADLEGNHWLSFAYEWFRDALEIGVSYALVDLPENTAETLADERALGIRPYLVHVAADNLIYWESEITSGRRELTKVRILEFEARPKSDGWGDYIAEFVREFDLVVNDSGEYVVEFTRWENVDGKWLVVDAGVTSFSSIPIVALYTKRTGFMTAEPPLLNLAWSNVTHWRSASEQRHCLAIGRRPFPFFSGFKTDELTDVKIGPYSGIRSSNASAKVELIEITGAAMDAGRVDLQDLKEEMAVQGAELLVRKSVQKTATESENERSETESQLGAMAGALEAALEAVIGLMMTTGGVTGTVSVSVTKDFDISSTGQAEIEALISLRKMFEITSQTLLEGMKTRGVLPDDFDVENEIEAISVQAPTV